MPVSMEPESEQPETVTTDTEMPNPASTDDENADQGEVLELVGALAAA
ncbi:hypothetical protein YWIDRAFT_07288 [Streptomyces sp. SceaMP-e96]|nr:MULTISPECIES: hypothetical protein [unclassified Streptomyces]MYT17663.1 hypothetical protein [Streptomyces sp. SID4951]SCK46010.1 hypothetical protein YWIDRAFT_07288 [Streptomyces sp. SceaMP-e96]